MSEDDLRAGVARAVITPPVGTPMAGFAGRGPVEDIHDELTATALVLEWGGSAVALVAVDLCFLEAAQVAVIRQEAALAAGLHSRNVIVNCSHNHYGPATDPGGRGLTAVPGRQLSSYVRNLTFTVAGLVSLARRRAVPARLSAGEGTSAVGVNRREKTPDGQVILGANPDGPCDPRVAVLRVDRGDGKPLATVLNFACHAVSLAGQCTEVSADFVGVARRIVEQETGSVCLFVQGAAGDINPRLMGMDWSIPVRLGVPLGAEAVRVYWECAPVSEGGPRGLRVRSQILGLPRWQPESAADAQLLAEELAARLAELDRAANGPRYWAELRLERVGRALALMEHGRRPAPINAEITAIGISNFVGLITAPGEVFNEIGQAVIAGSPFPLTLYSGYTNGYVGYLPTAAAFREGGYEVTHACWVAQNGGEELQRGSLALLDATYQAEL